MRARVWSTATALAAVLALSAGPARAQSDDDLDRARGQLDAAEADLAAADERVRQAADDVAEADARLVVAGGELESLAADLVGAEAALATARRRERTVAEQLQAATGELDVTVGTWEGRRSELEQRVVAAFKHGSAVPGSVLLGGVARSHDLHGVAVTLATVDRLVAEDRRLVAASVAATHAAVAIRAKVARLRAEAVETQAAAEEERREVAGLVDRQTALVASIDRERARRQAALASIESDQAARAALVRQLEQRVEQLTFTLATTLLAERADVVFDGPIPGWASALPEHGRRWSPAIAGAAASAGIDARLLAALVWTESNFSPTAVSRAGALGLTQLLPSTSRGLRVDPFEPRQNLVGGARYLRLQLERFGALDLALAAYNAGPGRVEAAGGGVPGIVETQLYVLQVAERYARLIT